MAPPDPRAGPPTHLPADLPAHARERLQEMRSRKLFTSDLSVNEFLLVKEAGFDPLGLVMGTSIYQIAPHIPQLSRDQPGCELTAMTEALSHARDLAMTRMEEEADALGADGIVGVRLTVNLNLDPQRAQWQQYRDWQEWSLRAGFPPPPLAVQPMLPTEWPRIAATQWSTYCRQMGWGVPPIPPWMRPRGRASFAFGANTAEFLAIGTAVKSRDGGQYRNARGKPFQSDLNGQDFWTLIRCGYRPVGFVMGNCVYYVPPNLLAARAGKSCELTAYTHALYDARELAIERLQDEAEDLGATGVVGVTVAERQHGWRANPWNVGNAALRNGEVIELFVIGTAVVPMASGSGIGRPELVLSVDDVKVSSGGHT